MVGGKENDLRGLDGSCIDGHVIAGTLPSFFPHLKKKKIGPSRMSPKAQRPLRGAKTLSSPAAGLLEKPLFHLLLQVRFQQRYVNKWIGV